MLKGGMCWQVQTNWTQTPAAASKRSFVFIMIDDLLSVVTAAHATGESAMVGEVGLEPTKA